MPTRILSVIAESIVCPAFRIAAQHSMMAAERRMDLLERDHALRELDAALADAVRGEGRVVLVSGEAGIGKTALAERFSTAHETTARMVWGACDPLSTPRPLGPLLDIAEQTNG